MDDPNPTPQASSTEPTQSPRDAPTRDRRITEARLTPQLSVAFGYGAMAPLAAAALAAWGFGGMVADAAAALAVWWGGALLVFLAGVRRGLSFRTPGGPRTPEMAAMLWLFALGLGALASTNVVVGSGLLLAGFASLMIIDPVAAWRGEAPPFFARLRPVQMAIPTASFAALLAAQV